MGKPKKTRKMGVRYDDVRRAKYHPIAAFHHKVKTATYSQAGLGKKAAGHRRRAKWHTAFGAFPEEDAASAFHAQFMPGMRANVEGAIAAIKKIADLSIEVAKVPNAQKWTGNPIEHESRNVRTFVEAARKSETPLEAFQKLKKSAHVSGEYDKNEAGVGRGVKVVKNDKNEIHRVAYDPGRAETKARAAKESVREFAKGCYKYLAALKEIDKTKGCRFYIDPYDEVGTMIDRLSREWANATNRHIEVSRGGRAGYVNMDEIGRALERTSIREGTKKAVVAPEVWQTEEALAAGAQTLLGVKAAYTNNLGVVRIRPPAPDDTFVLFPDDFDYDQ